MKTLLIIVAAILLVGGTIFTTNALTAKKYEALLNENIQINKQEQTILDLTVPDEDQEEDICSNIEGVQTSVPENMIIHESGECTQEVRVVKETVIVRQPAAPKQEPVSTSTEVENTANDSQEEPQRPFKSDGSLDLSQYKQVSLIDYVNNPKIYLNKPIKIVGTVVADFNSSSANSSNFISVVDRLDYSSSPKRIIIEIESDTHYSKVIENVSKWDQVLIFAFGANDQEFIITGDGPSYKEYEKFVVSDAIYSCTTNCKNQYDVGVKSVFSKTK